MNYKSDLYYDIYFALIALISLSKAQSYDSVVTTSLGQIGGKKNVYNGFTYFQYKGIQYAEPVDRFALSQAKLPWTGIHNGLVEGKVCPQVEGDLNYPGQIDENNCLVLTVTTPQDPQYVTEPLPVLVFIHGGAFVFGSVQVTDYDPEILAVQGIIVIQIQYRLGIFGWLTDGQIIPKNLGFKDCILALHWVQDNIAAFGGDPSKVTVAGESAGAMITSNLYEAPAANGLFRAVIIQSGTSMSPIGYQSNPNKAFHDYLLTTPCSATVLLSNQQQVNCLKLQPESLLSAFDGVYLVSSSGVAAGFLQGVAPGFVLEDPNTDPEPVVTVPPYSRIQMGKFDRSRPVLISLMSEEVYTFKNEINLVRPQPNSQLVPNGWNANNADAAGKEIKEHYAGTELAFPTASDDIIIRFGSDVLFNIDYRKAIELYTTLGVSIYCMEFAYASPLGENNDGNDKVGHADDLYENWRRNNEYKTSDPFVYQKRQEYNVLLTTFVKTGVPYVATSEPWIPVQDPLNQKCLIFSDTLTFVINPKDEHYGFWQYLFNKYSVFASLF